MKIYLGTNSNSSYKIHLMWESYTCLSKRVGTWIKVKRIIEAEKQARLSIHVCSSYCGICTYSNILLTLLFRTSFFMTIDWLDDYGVMIRVIWQSRWLKHLKLGPVLKKVHQTALKKRGDDGIWLAVVHRLLIWCDES